MSIWSAETKSYAIELRRQGESVKAIAAAVGKSKKAVEAYFMRQSRLEGLPPKPCRKGLNLFWTPEKIAKLLELTAGSMSRSIAAETMGVTKSAVTGAIDRLRLSGVRVDVHPSVFKTRGGRPRKPVGRILPPKAPPPDGLKMAPVTLFERTGCAFPVNDGGPYLFCNLPVHDQSPYCDYHGSLMVKRL